MDRRFRYYQKTHTLVDTKQDLTYECIAAPLFGKFWSLMLRESGEDFAIDETGDDFVYNLFESLAENYIYQDDVLGYSYWKGKFPACNTVADVYTLLEDYLKYEDEVEFISAVSAKPAGRPSFLGKYFEIGVYINIKPEYKTDMCGMPYVSNTFLKVTKIKDAYLEASYSDVDYRVPYNQLKLGLPDSCATADVLDKFINNQVKAKNPKNICQGLAVAFSWASSPEGGKFWLDIDGSKKSVSVSTSDKVENIVNNEQQNQNEQHEIKLRKAGGTVLRGTNPSGCIGRGRSSKVAVRSGQVSYETCSY